MSLYPDNTPTDADLYHAVDNFLTTLNGAIDDVQTTITLSTTVGLPTVGILTIGTEKVKYTGVSGSDVTGVIRGFSSTTADSHPNNASVRFNVVEEHHNSLKDEVIAIATDNRSTFSADLDDSVAPAATADSLKKRLDHVVTQIKNITGEADWKDAPDNTISALEVDVNNLQTDVGNLQTDVGNIQTDVGNIQTDVGNIQTDVGNIQTDVGDLQTDKKDIATGNAYKFETTDVAGNLQETTVTPSRAVVTDANGLPSASATTSTEIGYVSGVTSGIQGQLNTKASTSLDNLASVAINTSLVSDTDKTDNLGSASIGWDTGYINKLVMDGDTSGEVTIQTAANAGTYSLTLPTNDGDASQVLTTDGSGVLSWTTPASTGANTSLSNLSSVAINTSLVSDTDKTDDLGSSAIGWAKGYVNELNMDGSTSGVVTIKPADVAGTHTITLPVNSGTVGQVLTTDGSGALSWSSPSSSGESAPSFRNRVINGDMRIDQRRAGASTSQSSGTTYLGPDRWVSGYNGNGTITKQRVTDAPPGLTHSMRITATVANTSTLTSRVAYLYQPIEGTYIRDMAFGTASAQPVTLSFWIKSSLTGTFSVMLKNYAPTRHYVATYTVGSSNTWEKKTITIPGDTAGTWHTDVGPSGEWGMLLQFDLGSGSNYNTTAGTWQAGNLFRTADSVNMIDTLNATWYLTGVQLEPGATATQFEFRPETVELSLCQRYFEKTHQQSIAATSPGGALGSLQYRVWVTGTGTRGTQWRFMVPKRVAPTITLFNTDANSPNWWNATSAAIAGASSAVLIGETGAHIDHAQGAGETSGHLCIIQASAHADF